MRMTLAIISLCLLLGLGACGQKGPLVPPADAAGSVTS